MDLLIIILQSDFLTQRLLYQGMYSPIFEKIAGKQFIVDFEKPNHFALLNLFVLNFSVIANQARQGLLQSAARNQYNYADIYTLLRFCVALCCLHYDTIFLFFKRLLVLHDVVSILEASNFSN